MGKHNCKRCGKCCHMSPSLTKKDIAKIEKEFNIGEKKYVDKLHKKFIKTEDGKCIFLTESDGKIHCSIYKARPDICKDYPSEIKEDGGCEPVKFHFDARKR